LHNWPVIPKELPTNEKLFAAGASQSDIDKLKSAPGIDSKLLLLQFPF
jgi:hypothetical protein